MHFIDVSTRLQNAQNGLVPNAFIKSENDEYLFSESAPKWEPSLEGTLNIYSSFSDFIEVFGTEPFCAV